MRSTFSTPSSSTIWHPWKKSACTSLKAGAGNARPTNRRTRFASTTHSSPACCRTPETATTITRRAEGKAAYTTRNIVQGLRGFVVDARGKGWIRIKENPLLDPYIKKVLGGADTVAGKNTIIHLKKEEVAALITCTSPKIAAVRKVRNVVAIATGCRFGELQALTWRDLDLKARVPTARVFRQLSVPGTNATACFKDPKRKSHRILPVHPLAVRALRWWRDAGWKQHVGGDPKADDPVFPNTDGEFTFGHGARSFREDLVAAGLPDVFDGQHRFTFHACRRTFMSLLEAEGVPRETIGALAGHSSKSVTDRHYIAKNIDRFADAVDKLPLGDVLGVPT
jgi:integrase